jgi:hypothetical protein
MCDGSECTDVLAVIGERSMVSACCGLNSIVSMLHARYYGRLNLIYIGVRGFTLGGDLPIVHTDQVECFETPRSRRHYRGSTGAAEVLERVVVGHVAE